MMQQNNDLFNFFIKCLKDRHIELSYEQQIEEFNKMVFWANNMAKQAFNAYKENQNILRGKNDT